MSRIGSQPVILLTVFVDLLGLGMVLPLLPVYAKHFAQNEAVLASNIPVGVLVGLLMSSFPAMQFLLAPLWGRLSDRIGRRPVLMIGLAASVVFYALLGVATVHRSLAWLFVSRIGAGVAGATISTAHAYIADTTPRGTRAQGMASIGAAFGLAFTVGPLLALLALPGEVADPSPGPGYAAAGLSAVALALAYFRLPESLQPGRSRKARGRFDVRPLSGALAVPTVGLLLGASFLCALAFSNFEATLSLLVADERGGFRFTFRELCLTFAFLGLLSATVQVGIVRPFSARVSETRLAVAGAMTEVAGFIVLTRAAASGSAVVLFAGLSVLVVGFAFLTPSLNALISRRSDPAGQGEVMGMTQGISALARILGPLAGIPLFLEVGRTWPLWCGATLVGIGLLVIGGARGGRDYPSEDSP